MKTLAAIAIISQVLVSLTAAAPLEVDLTRRALPTPVSVATAKTFLADRKQSLLSILLCLPVPIGYSGILPYGLRRVHMVAHQKGIPAPQYRVLLLGLL